MSEDPGLDGVNWYGYCKDNPMSFVDPTGWWAQKDHGQITREAAIEVGWYVDDYLDALAFGAESVDDLLSSAVCPWSADRHFGVKPSLWQYARNYAIGNIIFPLGGVIGIAATPFVAKGNAPSREQFAEARKRDAIEAWRQGKKIEALFLIGQGLHALQDIYTHGNMMPIQHLFDYNVKYCEEHPEKFPYLWLDARIRSMIFLRQFIYDAMQGIEK